MGPIDVHGQVRHRGPPSAMSLAHIFRPHSDPNHKRNSNILGIHETVGVQSLSSKEKSHSCRCSTTLNIGFKKKRRKHVVQTQQKLPNTRSNSSQFIRARTNQTKQKFEEVSHPIFIVLNLSRKEISSPRSVSKSFTFRFRVRLTQRQSLFAPFWHAISCALTCRV